MRRFTLTRAQAWEIYQLAWYSDLPQREIGAMYDVTQSVVSSIKNGYSWNFEHPFPGLVIGDDPRLDHSSAQSAD